VGPVAVNPNWPLVAAQVAFNVGFADLMTPAWYDLTARMWSMECTRGRQYELDENQAGEGQIVFADHDEVLNTAHPNPGLPFAGNVVPYRQLLLQAQWPPAPVGAAVNLLNAAAQAPGPYDPSFESYATSTTPTWLTAVGGTAPSVGTTTPHTGSHDVGWSVANGTAVQGVSYQVPCIPGQQYTSSVYVQQAAASTQSLRVMDQVIAGDNYNRTGASTWGSADFAGGAWTTSGGSASDYFTTAGTAVPPLGVATQSLSTVNTVRTSTIGSAVDSSQLVLFNIPVVATGAEADVGVFARYVDANNYYFAEVQLGPDQSVTVRFRKNVAGVFSVIGSTFTQSWQYMAGSQIWVRFVVNGPALMCRAWLYGTQEPSTWQISTTDTSFTAAGALGVRSILQSGNTNTLPVNIGYQMYSATGSVLGTTTAATGSWQRLTVTWTATQPVHLVQLATSGTAVAGAVLLDDIQHEVGASASTFATTGPTIYGVHRGYVERWPSNWNYKGMYGYAQITSVDGFAALAAYKLHAAYRAAVMATDPYFYWPLAEPAGATLFSGVGTNATSLGIEFGPGGAAPTFAPGTTFGMAGDPGGTGVQVVPDLSNPNFPKATILGIGPRVVGSKTPLALPLRIGTSWAMTAAFWVVTTSTTTPNSGVWVTKTVNATAGTRWTPISVGITTDTFMENLPAGLFFLESGAVKAVSDGKPHLIVGVITQNSTTTTATKYVDGALDSTASTATSGIGGMIGGQATELYVAGLDFGGGLDSLFPSTLAHVAVWSRALTTAEITSLWTAGQGYVGENSGARISRYLSSVGYSGASAIDTGQSTMGADVAAEQSILLTDAQAVTTTENGNFWFSGQGTVTFTSRTRRYLTTTAKWTFGEQETPYQDDIAYDHDPTLVYNDVTVRNAGGASPEAFDVPSQAAFGPRTLPRDVNVQFDTEASDAANWLLSTHKAPRQRIATLTLDPASNPSIWPVALGIQIGDRITVKRRTAAFTMVADYFVESIAHKQDPESWTVTLQCSPASFWPTPWLLDSATYSVLGSTTVLGY
jgi:hypothetical protein